MKRKVNRGPTRYVTHDVDIASVLSALGQELIEVSCTKKKGPKAIFANKSTCDKLVLQYRASEGREPKGAKDGGIELAYDKYVQHLNAMTRRFKEEASK